MLIRWEETKQDNCDSMKEWANPYLGCHLLRHVCIILYICVRAKRQAGVVADQQAKQEINYAELAATPHFRTCSH